MKHEGFRLHPSALWLILGPVLACMWVAAVNYSNNLVYAILYLIASLGFISIFHTWRNLASLRVEHVRIQPAFAGEEVRMEIHLRNSGRQAVYGVFFARLGDEAGTSRRATPLRLSVRGGVRIAAGDSCSAEAVFPAERRGLYRFASLLVRSSYPFGLFWAGFRVPMAADYFVYPHPHGTAPWPELRPSGEQGTPASQKSGDDFAGVRAYLPGESLRHVDWKAYARGRPLSVKQFTVAPPGVNYGSMPPRWSDCRWRRACRNWPSGSSTRRRRRFLTRSSWAGRRFRWGLARFSPAAPWRRWPWRG